MGVRLPSESIYQLGAAMSIGQAGDQLQAAQDNRRGQGKAATLPE
ncbi:MAG: hypothetical protein AAGC93_24665 [Cyanobacteria bacterium P01_F01_bin.53]